MSEIIKAYRLFRALCAAIMIGALVVALIDKLASQSYQSRDFWCMAQQRKWPACNDTRWTQASWIELVFRVSQGLVT